MSIIFLAFVSFFRRDCVGYVRMDFGSGNEFWTTWCGNREDLNDRQFRAELNEVVNQLRKDGLLKDRYSMHKLCANISNLALGESHGFSAESENHLFLFRCLPLPGNYDEDIYDECSETEQQEGWTQLTLL